VDSIAAEVNGEVILFSEVRERHFQMNAMAQDPSQKEKETMRTAMDTLIEEKLIIQYGKEKEVKITDQEVSQAIADFQTRSGTKGEDFDRLLERAGMTMARYRSMLNDQLIARKVISMEVRSQAQITEDDAREYFNTHKELFTDRPKTRMSHILKFLPKTATEADWNKALEEITAIRREVIGGLDFAEAAKKYSDDPSRDVGGDLGEVAQGEMVEEFDKVAFSLKPDVVSDPVRTQYGYHLIKVGHQSAPSEVAFEKVRGEIQNRIYSDLMQSVREDWIKRLKKDALIEIKLQL